MAKFQLRLLFILLSAWKAAAVYCPEGWTPFGSKCYKYVASAVTFNAAQAACNSEDGYVAEIYSAEENQFLADLRDYQENYSTWIGLTDRAVEDDFIWDFSGNTAGYTNWKAGEPNDATVTRYNEDCVRMVYYSAQWVDVRCSVPHYYICERPVIDPCSPNPCQNGGECVDGGDVYNCVCTSEFAGENCELSCPEGWSLFGTNCYTYNASPVTFNDAKAACAVENAFVAEIYNEEENQFLSDLRDYQENYSTWIGLTDRAVEDDFIWDFSGNPAGYTNWKAGEPNDATVTKYNEDCVRMVYYSAQWVDVRCSVPHYYICEKSVFDV